MTITSRAIEQTARSGAKLVFVSRRVPDAPSYAVACDNGLGGREMADHLIDNGRRQMAYMAGSLDALREAPGLEAPDNVSVAGLGDRLIAARE